MMILTGSRAAYLSGRLPTWRAGAMCDWDFYGRAEDVERMRAYLRDRCGAYEEADDRIGSVHFLDGKGLRVSIMAWGPVADALAAAPDCFPACALDQDVTAIGPQTQLALKLGYLRAGGFHADKNGRDVDHWLRTLPPVDWTPAHDAVLHAMWRRAEEIFKLPAAPIEASVEMARLHLYLSGEKPCHPSS